MQGKPRQRADGRKNASDEAEFLVEEFDLTEREASDLVTDGADEAGATAAAVQKRRARREELEGVPVPEAPASDLTADSDETRLKPVVRARNDRTGAG